MEDPPGREIAHNQVGREVASAACAVRTEPEHCSSCDGGRSDDLIAHVQEGSGRE